jgi:hypothetical protein
LLKNHHAFESKVQEAQVAQVNQVARERPEGLRAALQEALALKDHAAKDADLKAALRAKVHAAKDADLKAVLRAKDHGAKDADLKAVLRAKDHAARDAGLKAVRRTALRAKVHAEKAHAVKDAGLRVVRRTALLEALAPKDQVEKDQAEKECGVRIPNASSSGPWNSIAMAMASSIATS